jgi:hypothetical protein
MYQNLHVSLYFLELTSTSSCVVDPDTDEHHNTTGTVTTYWL